jgi:hypothetical protein
MAANSHELFVSANHELRAFLTRTEGLVHGTSDMDAEDLRALGRLLQRVAPEMEASSRIGNSDMALEEQVQLYIANLRSLQVCLEQVRCVMLARRSKLEAARQHIEGVQSWANAYRQTA